MLHSSRPRGTSPPVMLRAQQTWALATCLEAITFYAQQGNVLGFLALIMYLSRVFLQSKNFPEAYRTLATGLSIVKRLKLPIAEGVFRAQINTLRSEIWEENFDSMVREMVLAAKISKKVRCTLPLAPT